ncbi:multidrug ABC transporter substrate-binding protein [Nakamurella endophytica]|uniref:Multidrug ABC transporter substrate-binding protein n=1 Tax=Nakamurella endophytica TaxID=1748367 RepID=A0A917SPW8_9ACTN|nr:multidrug ABC transporter substrate-binding protein [Nakamurella endophytica]
METLRTGLDAIVSHRLRSGLTMLGILIGIAAVILTVGLGLGSQQQVGAQISSLGSNLLIVSPGSSTSGGVRGGFGSASTLTAADAAALASPVAAPDIGAVAPVKSSSLSVTAGSSNWTTAVVGTSADWATVRSRTLAAGRFLSAADVADQAAVAVLGSETATELFGTTDVVGRTVTVNGVDLEVVGVLAPAGSDSSSNLDDQVLAPLPTVANRIVGGTNKESVSTIYLQAASAGQLSAAYQEAQALLLSLHHVTDSGAADWTIASQQSLLSTVTSVSRTLTVLLTGIAALSLLVGGIGVMNIMLVSVSERTREIGLRKALGAPPSAIRRQFLVEATILGLAGGLLGAALGIGGARVLPRLLSTDIVVSPLAVGGSIAIAVLIGVVFGVYPATRAARLAPIDALRSE